MCDKNIIELLNIDFGATNDEFNWITTGSAPIETVNGQLKLVPEDQTTSFSRGLGVLNASNDRVNLDINLDLYRPQTSIHDTMTVSVGVYAGNTLIDAFTIHESAIESGAVITHHFARSYKYADLSGSVSLKISVPEGFQNHVFLDSMVATNQKFCEDDVRTYFVLEDFFQDAIDSVSSGIQLLEWKIDDVETLTPAFFTENNAPGGDPDVDWLLANADIDGSNRVADTGDPNTWNPFASEFGLTFENVAGNFHGGKPTAVTSGSDYGSGIMTLGVSKPAVIIGDLTSQKGAFFIDIDFSKNLKIVFNALVNNTNVNVFDSPAMFRKYTIEWNVDTCSKKFYYQDQISATPNTIIPVDSFGFLSGITAGLSLTEIVGCDQSFAFNGNAGTFEFQIDFGTDIGECGIDYEAFSVPDKFEIEWNGQKYSSGFVGSSSYDQQLINLGIPQSDINTGNPSTGSGQLKFQKTTASPSSAIIRVSAPLGSTGWNIAGICPNGVVTQNPTVTLATQKFDYQINETVTFNVTASDDVSIASWIIDLGDGTTQSGTGTPPATITHTFTSQGSKNPKITVTDGDGLTGTDTVTINIYSNAQYKLTGTTQADCNTGINATLEVTSGFVEIYNKQQYFFGNQQVQNPPSTIMNITNGTDVNENIGAFEKVTVPAGTYTITSPPVDCSEVTSISTIVIL